MTLTEQLTLIGVGGTVLMLIVAIIVMLGNSFLDKKELIIKLETCNTENDRLRTLLADQLTRNKDDEDEDEIEDDFDEGEAD